MLCVTEAACFKRQVSPKVDTRMRAPKYPLEPLAKLRDQRVDDAERDLAGAVGARERAEGERSRAEQRARAHAEQARVLREAEAAALGRGELTVADLERLGAWERGVAADGETLARAVAERRAAEDGARDGERKAMEQVAARMADARVVERDRERWEDGDRKRAEAKEEEAAEEAAARPKADPGRVR
jgi:hypothetical protein